MAHESTSETSCGPPLSFNSGICTITTCVRPLIHDRYTRRTLVEALLISHCMSQMFSDRQRVRHQRLFGHIACLLSSSLLSLLYSVNIMLSVYQNPPDTLCLQRTYLSIDGSLLASELIFTPETLMTSIIVSQQIRCNAVIAARPLCARLPE